MESDMNKYKRACRDARSLAREAKNKWFQQKCFANPEKEE